MLVNPAIVNFIHSFSAQGPQDPDTVAGRWLENGAYAYYGSMDEPFLNAFLPLEVVAKRWFSGAPFVCAVRQDEPRVWKLNYFGDPLITYGPAAARHDDPLTLERATNLNDIMRDALKDKDLAAGATALILMGRDEDAVKLAAAVVASEETALTPELARAVLFAAYRQRDKDLFLKLYAALDPVQQREAITADTLWQLCRADLATTSDVTLVNWLRATIRNPSMVHDADALAPAVKRLYGIDVVRSMYGTLLQRTQDPQMKKWLTEAAAKY